MSRRPVAIIAAFEKLSPTERKKVVTELLRRVAISEHSAPDDEELVAAADEVFQALDHLEADQR